MVYVWALVVLCSLGAGFSLMLLTAEKWLVDYGTCSIGVNDQDQFTVEGGRMLSDALYQKRIFIPSACGGKGTCGYCKVKVLEGGGVVLPPEMVLLTPEEIRHQIRLACQVKVKGDLALEIPQEYLDIQEFRAEVVSARMVTYDTREILLRLVEPPEIAFRPGQYVQVEVPGAGEPVLRAYSISSQPDWKNEIELLVRLVPGGLGSTYLHEVEPGDEVTFTGPYGEFELSEDEDSELVCVAGGCGLAPMRSLIRFLYDRWPHRRCVLFFGARSLADVLYFEDFQHLASEHPNFEVHYALSHPKRSDRWEGEVGFIHESVRDHLKPAAKCQAFLCGPPALIEATMKVLREKGIPEDKVFYDEF